MSNNRFINIVLVHLDTGTGLNAVYQAPSGATLTAGDRVEDFNGAAGWVIRVLFTQADSDAAQFITACFGAEELPKLKGISVYHEFLYPYDDEEQEAQA